MCSSNYENKEVCGCMSGRAVCFQVHGLWLGNWTFRAWGLASKAVYLVYGPQGLVGMYWFAAWGREEHIPREGP